MAILGFLLFDIVLLQCLAPAPTGVHERGLVANTWARGARDDDRFELFRAQDSATAMGGEVIIVVGEHGGAIQMLARGSDAEHLSVATPHEFAQAIFGVAGSQAPDRCGIAQFGLAFVDIQINRLRRGAVEDDAVITCGFQIRPPVAAGGASTQRCVRERAQIHGGQFGPARSKAVPGERSGQHDDDVLRTKGFGIEWQFFH